MDDYWRSPEAMRRKFGDRQLRTARAIVDQEPRLKSWAGKAEASLFRAAVREDIALKTEWPKPRATLALALRIHGDLDNSVCRVEKGAPELGK